MREKNSKSKKKLGPLSKPVVAAQDNQELQKQIEASSGWALVDPSRIRYQHSRIRPYFSGCGRSVEETLDDIRKGKISPNDLPPIQVIIGNVTSVDGKPWYFSLNNRRLWVLKECHKEGLLERQNNMIKVRTRPFKSKREEERYTVQNCSLEARFMQEKCIAKMKNFATDGRPIVNCDGDNEDNNISSINFNC